MKIYPGEPPRPTELPLSDKVHYLRFRIKRNKHSKFGGRGNLEVFSNTLHRHSSVPACTAWQSTARALPGWNGEKCLKSCCNFNSRTWESGDWGVGEEPLSRSITHPTDLFHKYPWVLSAAVWGRKCATYEEAVLEIPDSGAWPILPHPSGSPAQQESFPGPSRDGQ